MLETQPEMSPPNNNNGKGIGAGFADDDDNFKWSYTVTSIGNEIASLGKDEQKELGAYIEWQLHSF